MLKNILVLLSSIVFLGGLFYHPTFVQAQIENPPHKKPSRATPTPLPPEEELQPQIIGGTVADEGEYPWQVALIDATESNPFYGQFCGGSLIAPGWVLTAAHCVQEDGNITNPLFLSVVAGINKLSSGPMSGSQGQRRNVSQIYVHWAFNEDTFDHDLALLRLASPFSLDDKVKIIPLATAADSARYASGVLATVTGWGRTNPPPEEPIQYPDDLMEVEVPIVDQTVCSTAYPGQITANMLCAGYSVGGKDSCQGDSGGPLIVPDGNGGWLQAGIVSWGRGCAQPNKFGVYTRIANYTAWINFLTNPSASASVVYLPMVVKGLPANTASIINGDFEQGDTAWTEFSSNGWDLIVNNLEMPNGIFPHGGNWAAWLGGDNNELSRLYQTVTISNSTPYLVFWHWIDSIDPCGLDQAGVKINNQTIKNYDLCQTNNTGQWQKQVVDLNLYKGQSVQLEFFVQTTANTDSWWFLDDVSLQNTP